jgi:hypothetical protein
LAQPANTGSTAKYSTIREDLQEVVYDISPTETPVMQLVGRKGKVKQQHHEWSQTALAAANEDNKTIEGDDATNDAPTTATRLGNYTQLMDKVAQVSTTAEASKVAGDIQKMKKQIIFKTKELKRDMEKRLCSNKPAVPGTDSVAGETAGIGAYLRTNVSRGAGGANPTLSGTTTGYPNAAPTDGTQRAFTEDLLKPVVQASWEAGAEPTHVIVGGFNKVQASGFTGNATRTKKAEDKKLVASIAVYESDFGELQIVPARLTVSRQALILDPEYVEIAYLQSTQNTDLAKTGHSDRRMIWNEWMTVIGAENAHGLVADLTTS